MAGKAAWNRGLTWAQMYSTPVLEQQRARAATWRRTIHDQLRNSPDIEHARRTKLSQIARIRGLGGYERGSGRGKKGWYQGQWCDSTYELAFVVWALDHEIPFERNTEFFPYEFSGRLLRWMPDFRLADGTYVEIKGYLTAQAQAKFDYFLRPLRVFRRGDLQEMFDYVQSRYGGNLLALYE